MDRGRGRGDIVVEELFFFFKKLVILKVEKNAHFWLIAKDILHLEGIS